MKSTVRQPLTNEEMMSMRRELKKHFASSQEHKAQARRILFEMYDRDGAAAVGFNSFQDMVLPFLGFQYRYARELVNATKVERAMCEFLPEVEHECLREHQLSIMYQIWKFNAFDIQAVLKVYREASEAKGAGIKPTAADIRRKAIELHLYVDPPKKKVRNCALLDVDDLVEDEGSNTNTLYTTHHDLAMVTHNIDDGSFDALFIDEDGVHSLEQLSSDMFTEAVEFAELESGKVSPIRENLNKPKRVLSPSKQESLQFSD
jgi:hypothetical protein